MYLLYFLIPALCMIPVGIYIYFYLTRMAKFWNMNIEKKAIRTGIIVLTACIVAVSVNLWGMGSLIVLHVIAMSLCMELINCGDIVDENTTISQMQEALQALGSIKSTYGTYYVYGNHDKNNYSSKPYYTVKQLDEELVSNKIKLLQDEAYNINDEFTIAGRDDVGFAHEEQRKSGSDLIAGVDSDKFILLLDHQPYGLKENDELGYDLELSGHTHAGQIWPVGELSGILGIGELNYGYKQLSNMQAIVSSGMAGWGYPIRTGSHSEYVIIDIQPK